MVYPRLESLSVLYLSTAHLTWATIQALENTKVDDPAYPCFGGPLPFGFFVYVHDENDGEPPIPADLWACMEFGRRLGASYIRFDSEEEPVSGLADHSATHPRPPLQAEAKPAAGARYTFDLKAFFTVRVQADSEAAARAWIRENVDGVEGNFGLYADGQPIVSQVGLDGEYDLIEVDGVHV